MGGLWVIARDRLESHSRIGRQVPAEWRDEQRRSICRSGANLCKIAERTNPQRFAALPFVKSVPGCLRL